jgi:uncharacterized protein YdiU (UPF0061 family)
MYDGNPAYEKAPSFAVAPSFIRFGNFELFSSQSDLATLKHTDFTIKYHFPEIKTDAASYVQLFNP